MSHPAFRPQIEALESRLAPACTMRVDHIPLTPPHDLLVVDCDAAPDVVTLSLVGSNIQVNANGDVRTFALLSNSRIGVNGGAGADTLNVERTRATTPVTLNAGDGNDQIHLSPVARNLDNLDGHVGVNGQGGLDTVTVYDRAVTSAKTYTHTAGNLARVGAAPIDYITTENVVLQAGDFNDTVQVWGTSVNTALRVHAGAGNDTVHVSRDASGYSLDALDGNVVVHGEGGTNGLVVHDNYASSGHTYTLQGSLLTRDGAAGITFGTVQNLAVIARYNDSNTVNVLTTVAGMAVTISTGIGNDQFNVTAVTAGSSVTLNAGAGNDTFQVGDAPNTLAGIQGALTVDGDTPSFGSPSQDVLTLNDQGTSAAQTYTLTATTVARGAAVLTYRGLERLTLNAGSIGDTIHVQGTATGTATTVHAGAGNDVVHVQNLAVSTALTVNGGIGNDTFQVSVLSIGAGGLSSNGEAGTDTLVVNLPATASDRDWTILDTTVSVRGRGCGLCLVSSLTYHTMENLTLHAGNGDDLITVANTALGTATQVHAGPGDDTVTAGTASLSLSNLRGALTVHGEGDTDALTITDQAATGAHTYLLAASTLDRDGAARITYGTVESLVVNASNLNDTLSVASTAALTPATVNAGAGNDSVTVGTPTLSLSNIQGVLTVNGEGGTDALTITDQAATGAHSYEVTSLTVDRSGAALINYRFLESLGLTASNHDDVLSVLSTLAATPVTLRGNGGSNYLLGPNAVTQWSITGTDAGSLSAGPFGSAVSFLAIGTLVGGSATDRFVFANGGALSGYVDGGGGAHNQLDYSARTGSVYANLATYSATGTWFMFNIQDATGGAGSDILVGDDQSNVLNGGAGRDLLIAGGWSYSLNPDVLHGGAGEDLLIAGYTVYDFDTGGELGLILAEWNRLTDYWTRAVNLYYGIGVPALNEGTVFYNYATGGNTLMGGPSEQDFFFGDPSRDAHDQDPATEWFVQVF